MTAVVIDVTPDVDRLRLEITIGEKNYYEQTSHAPDRLLGLQDRVVRRRWHHNKFPDYKGSFGDVYVLKTKPKTDTSIEQCALKCIRKEFMNYGGDGQAWKSELNALAEFSQLKHQKTGCFVDFHGWYDLGEQLFLFMEFLPDGNLGGVVPDKQVLPEEEVIGIAVQILQGLRIMHGLGYAHRDMKPENILIARKGPNWWIKLADFGFTKKAGPDGRHRTEVGTQGYTAPEVLGYAGVNNEAGDAAGVAEIDANTASELYYDHLIDIWSCGSILFKLLTGKVPFPTKVLLEKYCKNNAKLPVERLGPDFSEACRHALKGMLEAAPTKRLSAVSTLESDWLLLAASNPPERRLRNPTCFTRGITRDQQAEAIRTAKSKLQERNWTNTSDAIHGAAIEGDVEMILSLLRLGVNADVVRQDPTINVNMTPLCSAVCLKDFTLWTKVASLLYDGGCDVNLLPGSNGETALHAASKIGSVEKIKWLLMHQGESSLHKESSNMQPLHIASQNGHPEVVDVLVDAGADVNAVATTQFKPTALHLAADHGHVKVVSALLGKGADAKLETAFSKRSPLHVSVVGFEKTPTARLELTQTVTPVLARATETITKDIHGITPLQYAAMYNLYVQALDITYAFAKRGLTQEVTADFQEAYNVALSHKAFRVADLLGDYATNEQREQRKRLTEPTNGQREPLKRLKQLVNKFKPKK